MRRNRRSTADREMAKVRIVKNQELAVIRISTHTYKCSEEERERPFPYSVGVGFRNGLSEQAVST